AQRLAAPSSLLKRQISQRSAKPNGCRLQTSSKHSTRIAQFEMHPADAFPPKQACRLDRRPAEQSNARVFQIIDSGCVMSFQTIQIAVLEVLLAARPARPQ